MSGTVIYIRRKGSLLVPVSMEAEELVRALPLDKVLRADVIRLRSGKKNAFYWAFCHKIALMLEAMGDDTATKDNVSDKFKLSTGYCIIATLSPRLQLLTGQRLAAVPTSIAFHMMDQSDFDRFIDRVLAFTLTELLPHMPTHELRGEIEDMLYKMGAAA